MHKITNNMKKQLLQNMLATIAALFIAIIALPTTAQAQDYVDLGLPSGTKWATCNLGASKPSECGDYYAWGETEPKTEYTWATYKWGTEDNQTKYNATDGKTTLDPEDDAATVKLGSSWRMPTFDEIMELLNHCTWTWTTQDGKNGYEVKGTNGNSIFVPAAGSRIGSELYDAGIWGDYWSSSLDAAYSDIARYLGFESGGHDWDYVDRRYGFTVRPVYADIPAGISQTETSATATVSAIYSLDGSRQPRMQRGVNIVKMSDGTTRKVIRK
jgi:hypothetical protein